jgi:prepilin-type N-terminal cleavage/methylation domain-containing protein
MHLKTRSHRAHLRLMTRSARANGGSAGSREIPAGAQARRGFALPELIVAMVILSVGILSLASVSGGVMRQMRQGNQGALAAMVAQSRLEKMRSQQCGNLSSGSATTRSVTEVWRVATPTASTKLRTIAETVSYTPRAGATSRLVVSSVVPCQ